MGFVPTVGLRGDRGDLASQIDEACRNAGFLQIVGRGLDHRIERAAWEAAQAFFRSTQ